MSIRWMTIMRNRLVIVKLLVIGEKDVNARG